LDAVMKEINGASLPADVSTAGWFAGCGPHCLLVCFVTPLGALYNMESHYITAIYNDVFAIVKSKATTLVKINTNDALMAYIAQQYVTFLKHLAFFCSNMCGEASKITDDCYAKVLFASAAAYPASDGKFTVLQKDFDDLIKSVIVDNNMAKALKNADNTIKQAALELMSKQQSLTGAQQQVSAVAQANALLQQISQTTTQ